MPVEKEFRRGGEGEKVGGFWFWGFFGCLFGGCWWGFGEAFLFLMGRDGGKGVGEVWGGGEQKSKSSQRKRLRVSTVCQW